ncbi:hypothetical protein PanWU01x14_333390 [Parasponia andersonii]|uniref:Uncharacterized protein n=1 Tax=Parasponia andersonii TaxID=3476 RepID=A0A2P5AGZ1_PARAD|nr:hypothetical protein PanWU01x14_333390 [Parasponia andersonii]
MGDQLIQEPDAVHLRNNPPLNPGLGDSSMADPLDFSALRLESSPPAAISLHHHNQHHSPCANCGRRGSGSGAVADHSNSGSGSHKRPLPPPSTSTSSSLLFPGYDPQPKPKKLFLDQTDAAVSAADPPPLPARSGSNPVFLRRCVSDPYHAPPAPAYQSPPESFPGSGFGIFSNTCRSPENVIKTNTPNSVTPCSATLPPRAPLILRRCVSDPTPSPAKSFSRTSSSTDLDKTPNSRKMKKMWHCWKEMNSRMEEFMGEEQADEDDNGENDEVNITDQPNDIINATKDDCEVECEESLSVERQGEGLIVRFNCNCGRAYEFLLPGGGNCYYKLL